MLRLTFLCNLPPYPCAKSYQLVSAKASSSSEFFSEFFLRSCKVKSQASQVRNERLLWLPVHEVCYATAAVSALAAGRKQQSSWEAWMCAGGSDRTTPGERGGGAGFSSLADILILTVANQQRRLGPRPPRLPHSKFSIPFGGFDSPPDRSRSRCFSLLYAPFGSSQCFQQEADTLFFRIPVEKKTVTIN